MRERKKSNLRESVVFCASHDRRVRMLIEKDPCLDKQNRLAQPKSSLILNMTEGALREPAGMVASGSELPDSPRSSARVAIRIYCHVHKFCTGPGKAVVDASRSCGNFSVWLAKI